MKCDGKCYLMQKLQKNHQQDQQELPVNTEDRQTINLYYNPIASFVTFDLKLLSEIEFRKPWHDKTVVVEFFHPPEA